MKSSMGSTPTKEYSWLSQHPEIEEKYMGEWIAVHAEQIVAHDKDLQKVLKDTSHLEPPPHLTYVEEQGLAAYALRFLL